MVTVIDYVVRNNEDGSTFVTLNLQGDLEMVQSKETGRFYATVRKTSMVSSLNEASAKQVIGQKLPGSIQKVSCEPYEHTNKKTGEIIQLNYRYKYVPEESSTIPVQNKEVKVSSNGRASTKV